MLIRLNNNHINITYKGFGLIYKKRHSYGCFIDLRHDMSLMIQIIKDKPGLLVFLRNKVI